MSGPSKKYISKHFRVSQQSSSEQFDLSNHEFDMAFCCSSWDERSRDICHLSLKARECVLVKLEFRDPNGLRDATDAILEAFVDSDKFSKSHVVQQDDGNISDVLILLFELVEKAKACCNKPLKAFVDITGFPRIISLGLITYLLRSDYTRDVLIYYSEAFYGKDSESVQFTEGEWATFPVPGCEGIFSPLHKNLVLVSTGFEGKKTLRSVYEREPDRVSLLVPDPGFTPEMTERTRTENERIVEYYKIPEDQIRSAGAADLVEALGQLESGLERFEYENVYYLCCGTKPHSLALAIRSCLHPAVAVLYNQPESYKFSPAIQRGSFWLYCVENLAVFK